MNMGVATVPNLSELEAEIERRGLLRDYIFDELMGITGGLTNWGDGYDYEAILCLLRLTETQKTQAALKVLNG